MTRESKVQLGLRPTLIVGLGGSGHEVLVRLKARYLDAYGDDVFRIIKILAFDTAEESIDAIRENGDLVQLDRSTELIHIGNVPTQRLMQNLDLHPTIKAWLPSNIPARAITAGAMQVRPMGRLALFNHFDMIKARLDQSIRDLSNITQRGEIGEGAQIAKSQGINVFIVTSVCGGTGSGIFIDMAYALRQLCWVQGLDENYCHVNGYLILPQAFATVTGDAIRANAYAALSELNYFTKGGGFSVEYPGGTMVEAQIRPFNICYLIDAVNERGKMLAGMNELSPMVAEAIFLQTASQVGDAQKSVFDNVKALDSLDQGFPTSYSGLGTASLVFPAGVIIDACAARYCVNLLKTALLKAPVSPDIVTAEVNAVTEKMRLTADAVKLELSKDEKGRPMRIQLDARQLEKVSEDLIVKAALERVQNEEDRNLNSRYQVNMEVNLQRLLEETAITLNADVNRIVNDQDLGLHVAIDFLDMLDREISQMVAQFTEQKTEADKRIRALEVRNANAQRSLVEATTSFIVGRKKRVEANLGTFVRHHKSRLDALLDKNLLSLALVLLAKTSDDVVRVRRQELKTLKDKLQVAQEHLAEMDRELASGKSRARSPLTYEITDAGDVDRFYERFTRDLIQELPRLFEEHGALHTWTARGYEDVETTLLNFGRSVFASVRQVEIEQVIMDKRDDVSPAARLEELREDSVPFWNRDLTRLSSGATYLETIAVIGVPDRDTTLYKDVRAGEVLASTHDRHGITVLTTRHGLTVYALLQFEDYKRRYERYRERQIAPLHCFDILNTRWLKTLFGLGLALGYIKKESRNHFAFYPPAEHEALQERFELGHGLRKAMDRFVSSSEYPQQMEALVDIYIKQQGEEVAWQAIEDYMNEPLSVGRDLQELEKELKGLLFEYRQDNLTEPTQKR